MPTLESIEITDAHVSRLLEIVDAGLISGAGSSPIAGQICTEQAVCMALGLPFSDDPECVSRALRSLKIRLNDSGWSSNKARAKGMRKLAVAQLGTRGTLNDAEFVSRITDMCIRKIVPRALRHAARIQREQKHKDALESAAKRCVDEGTRDAALGANNAAAAAAAAAASYAAASAADAASSAAASAAAAASYAAASASSAAAAAASSAASSAAAAASSAADAASKACARDAELTFFADLILEILKDMEAPGCKWLHLCQ